jgi:hypothetical protein
VPQASWRMRWGWARRSRRLRCWLTLPAKSECVWEVGGGLA